MKKILLTGFEPFLNHSINPTERIVSTLHGETIGSYTVAGEILPVDFGRTGLLMIDLLIKHRPDAVISLGLAAGRERITPERIAINCNEGPVDNKGYKPSGERIMENGPDGYFSRLPIHDMVRALQDAGLPAKISNTAGAYLCNNVMYHTLHYLAENDIDIPAGFIHIPASHELAMEGNMPSWSQDDLSKAVKTAISSL